MNNVAFSLDGQTLISSSHDGSIAIWDIASYYPQSNQSMPNHLATSYDSSIENISSLAATVDGQLLAVGSQEGVITLWNVAQRQPIGQPMVAHSDQVYSLTFSPDSQMLASSSADGTIILWDVNEEQQLGQLPTANFTAALTVVFSPDEQILASGHDDGTIILWNPEQHQQLSSPLKEHNKAITSLVFSSNGQTLASGSNDDTVILWDVTTFQTIGDPHPIFTQGVLSLAFNPDDQTLAVSGNRGDLTVWDISTGSEISWESPVSQVNQVVFSPNGQQLASTSLENTFILWDLATDPPTMIGSPFNYDIPIRSAIAYILDGKIVASGDDKGRIILWDADPILWQQQACRLVARNLTWNEWQQYFPNEPYVKTCPEHPVHETVVVEKVHEAANLGDAALYGQTLEWAQEFKDAALNNYVCSFGSYARFQKSVPFCKDMVKLDPDNGRLRGSRGLAELFMDRMMQM